MTTTITALKDWRYSVDTEAIAWAVFDREGESMNTLGRRPLEELGAIVMEVERQAAAKAVKGLILISGKEKGFIAGADIREFDSFKTAEEVSTGIRPVLEMLDRIEALTVPVVAAMHGVCLGGGLELALACHWRIATRDDATRLGFPEVNLGIFPGFNGTARSIRQAGAPAAMDLMLRGRMVRASAARGLGLVDELASSPQNLRWMARRAVLAGKRSKGGGGLMATLTSFGPGKSYAVKEMRKGVRAAGFPERHYPAPYRLIDLFERHGTDTAAMKRAETPAFAPLMVSDTARNLRRAFRLSEMLKAQAPKGLDWKPTRIHVIGAGTMGADIAGWCAVSGMEVSLQDISPEQIEKGRAAQMAQHGRRLHSRAERQRFEARLVADPKGEHIPRADLVIEAIVEKLEVKQNLFKSLEGKLKPGAVLATNTSSLMIEDIAAPLADPGRLVGIHFFNPVAKMMLVEVVRGQGTRESEVAKGCAFVTAISKLPLVVKSCPGFLVNRVLGPYMMGAMKRLELGTSAATVDKAAESFGMRMGPIEMADTVGLDICAHVGRILGLASEKGNALDRLVADGKLGKKSGQGFYAWKDDKPAKGEVTMSEAELDRLGRELVEPLIQECKKCVAEGVVANADLADAGIIFATGFAPFRGGPLHFAAEEARAQGSTGKAMAAE